MSDKAGTMRKLNDLVLKRDRIGKKALTSAQRIKILNQIYDSGLYWLESLVVAGQSKGTGAAAQILRTAREEITAWENNGVTQKDYEVTFDIPGLDFSGYSEQRRDA